MSNIDFYNQNADNFFSSTVDIDVSSLYGKFLQHLPGSKILDAGCGSARDAKAFMNMGLYVSAFDASKELAKRASGLLGAKVKVCTFQEFQSTERYDGIWACASLLHVAIDEMSSVLRNLRDHLSDEGVLYCSFKYGNSGMKQGGRTFTNMDEYRLRVALIGVSLEIVDEWTTVDFRKGRESEKWLHAVLRKV